MSGLDLSSTYEIIQSARGLAILKNLQQLHQDDAFWASATGKEIGTKVLDILNIQGDQPLSPTKTLRSDHNDMEAYLLNEVVRMIFHDYVSCKKTDSLAEAFNEVMGKRPSCFVVRKYNAIELGRHRDNLINAREREKASNSFENGF